MGGIPTNVQAEVVVDSANTVLPGLYAAGECACVSVHGANRLGTNSLLDIVVFGRRAGINAAEHAARTPDFAELGDDPAADLRRHLAGLLDNAQGERAAATRSDLQVNMDDKAMVYRTEVTLKEMADLIEAFKERYARVWVQDKSRRFNTDLVETVELGFLLDLAETLVASALARTESRGAHFREDFPTRDDATWMRHTLASRGDGEVTLAYKPVTVTRYQPMERKY
jgi:succinate dehydrogenase / fumarate reductase, flavoprotein subunit